MYYCINPNCSNRENTNELELCQACGSQLLIRDRYRLIKPLRPLDPEYPSEIFEVEDRGQIKVLKSLVTNRTKLIELFEQEVNILAELKHPGIPRVEPDSYFCMRLKGDRKLHCLVMENVPGENLEDWLFQYQLISQDLALQWLKQLVQILDYIHQNQFFYRDIKPSNIILKPNGQLVLIDFGTARKVTETVIAGRTITIVNSYGYTAPEQIDGRAVPQSDFFALGRTFVHLLTGIFPEDLKDFQTGRLNWRNSAPQVSQALADLIDDLMAPFVQNRPQSPAIILHRLDRLVKDRPRRIFTLQALIWGYPIAFLAGLGIGAITRLTPIKTLISCDSKTLDIRTTYGIVFADRSWQCFATAREALSAVSQGRINLSPSETVSSLSSNQLEEFKVNAILCQLDKCKGTWWMFVNYQCGNSDNIPAYFQMRTSSLMVGRCGVTLYRDRDSQGHRSEYFSPGTWSLVGSNFDNKASSLEFDKP